MRLMNGDSFEEVIEMRDDSASRIIGFGNEGPDVEGPANLSNLSIVTAVSGALLVEINAEKAEKLNQS